MTPSSCLVLNPCGMETFMGWTAFVVNFSCTVFHQTVVTWISALHANNVPLTLSWLLWKHVLVNQPIWKIKSMLCRSMKIIIIITILHSLYEMHPQEIKVAVCNIVRQVLKCPCDKNITSFFSWDFESVSA